MTSSKGQSWDRVLRTAQKAGLSKQASCGAFPQFIDAAQSIRPLETETLLCYTYILACYENHKQEVR